MTSTRREFLNQFAAGMAGASLLGGLGKHTSGAPRGRGAAQNCLIAVYLRGGADALSMIVPYDDPHYQRLRPTIALPGPDASGEDQRTLPLDDRFSLNSCLKQVHTLYKSGHCAPIVAVGSPHPTRSHFDAQDFMERGAPGQKTVATGWLNRYLQATRTTRDANLRAVSLQPLLPRSLRGKYPVLARPSQEASLAMEVYAQMYLTEDREGGRSAAATAKQAVQQFGARTIEQLHELDSILHSESSPEVSYPATAFGRQMRDLAKLIKANRGLEVAAFDYGGWDHHVDAGPASGQMARQLTDVSDSMGAFAADLGSDLFGQVLILVMSEFGRNVRENANGGTDHGHGGAMLAIGGRVRGNKVYGKWTDLDESHLYEGRDLPVHTDFRTVFAESLQGMFRFDGSAKELFPSFESEAAPLGFLVS